MTHTAEQTDRVLDVPTPPHFTDRHGNEWWPESEAVPIVLSRPDILAVSLDWTERTPKRRPGMSDAEFRERKGRFARNLTSRWKRYDPDGSSGRDPQVFGEVTSKFAQDLIKLAWSPAWYRGSHRTKGNFLLSRLLAFDIDDGWGHAEAVERCEAVGVKPFIIYPSPSWRPEHERYRFILLLDSYITDRRVYEKTLKRVHEHVLLSHTDPAALEAGRFFYPGTDILVANEPEDCVISIEGLADAIEIGVREGDDQGHAARTMRQIRRELGLTTDEGALDSFGDDVQIGESTPVAINESLIGTGGNPPIQERDTSPSSRSRPRASSAVGRTSRATNIPGFIENLLERCELAAEFAAGPTPGQPIVDEGDVRGWLRENELFGLMSNVNAARGGSKWFLERIRERPDLYGANERGEDYWQPRLTTHANTGRLPQRCEAFCPYHDHCQTSGTILETIRRRTVFEILKPPVRVRLDEARESLDATVESALSNAEPGVVESIRAEPGSGKSERHIRWQVETGEPVILAVPTHALKEQMANRFRSAGLNCETTPALPEDLPEEHAAQIAAFHEVGDHDGARRYILDHQSDCEALRSYVEQLERALGSPHTIVTTHARLVLAAEAMDPNRLIIVDEDPMKSLIRCGSVPLADLVRLRDHMARRGVEGAGPLGDLIGQIEAAEEMCVLDLPRGLFEQVQPVPHLQEAGVSSPVATMLASEVMLVTRGLGEPQVCHVTRGSIPRTRRVVMLSATADEEICRAMFGDAMRFHEVPMAEPVGCVRQHLTRTCSRMDLRRNGEPDVPDGYAVITFKSSMAAYDSSVLHFGAVEGLDHLAGHNLSVIGTPHVRAESHLLIAHCLGRQERGPERMSFRTVERNGMRFSFMTYPEGLLRTVQLGMIEAELRQAVGRARALTHPCEVVVHSNYPLPGAEFVI